MHNQLTDYLIEKRRYFHQNPELGFQEYASSAIIQKELEYLGYEVTTGMARTGVVAVQRSAPGTPVIMLRFDMDALPIQEETGFSFQSRNPGVMHACGHDAHMAIGLGVARELRNLSEPLTATIKLVFQPAEEGLGGAAEMIADGVLENPTPDYCLALHFWNEKSIGWVALTEGVFMAGADTFQIDVLGRGGHGALPQDTHDPILAAAQIIQAIQTIVSRNLSPLESGVISVCSVHGGSAFNVIPQSVCIKGTIRYMQPDVRELLHQRLIEISTAVGVAFDCEAKVSITEVTPPVINDSTVIEIIATQTMAQLPQLEVVRNYHSMVSEDYSLFLNRIPGCFLFFGSGVPEPQQRFGHHHPRFNIDEQVMPLGVKLLVQAVQDISSSINK